MPDFDRTHTFVTAANWELPFGKGKKFATQASGRMDRRRMAAESRACRSIPGGPFIVTADGSGLNAPGNTQVADQIRADVTKLGGVGVGAPFYDPSAFARFRSPELASAIWA